MPTPDRLPASFLALPPSVQEGMMDAAVAEIVATLNRLAMTPAERKEGHAQEMKRKASKSRHPDATRSAA